MEMSEKETRGYRIINGSNYEIQVCFDEYFSPDDTPWHIHNPLIRHLPVLATQLAVAIFIQRLIIILLKPFRQPRFVAEIMTTIIIGPSGLAGIPFWKFEAFKWLRLFPFENNSMLESFANLGVTYYMFLVGLEMDLSTLKHTGKKSWSIALAGFFVPLFIGAAAYFLPILRDQERQGTPMGAVFWAISLTITSFPDLARTLSDVKLLHTELGRTALTSAIITDICTWIFLVAAVTVIGDSRKVVTLAMLPIVCFVVLCLIVLRPGIAFMVKHTKNKQGKFSDMHVYCILIGVVVCGFITDVCGSHSLVGGFIFGLVFPKGELAIEIMEKTEEFVAGILLPSFFLSSGLRTNFHNVVCETKWSYVVLIATMATSAKILSTALVSSIFGMSLKESLTLGGLMNTKGVFALIVLNEGRSLKTLDVVYMAVMVLVIMFMTCLVRPIVSIVNRTREHSRKNVLRTIQGSDPDAELRILACIHSVQNLSGVIRLLEASNSTKKSPMCVFAAHLIELTEHASTMLIVNDKLKTNIKNSTIHEKSYADDIFSAFENYKMENQATTIHSLTVLSPYTTMHKDIFKLVEDNGVKLILIPFHKQPTADGEFHGDNHAMKEVNKHLLVKAPCSVGILVDRGLGSAKSSKLLFSGRSPELRFAMLFIGGPDDHEALSCAWRMTGKKGVTLTVVRFRLGRDAEVGIVPKNRNNENEISLATKELGETKKEFDDDYINEFRFKSMCNESIIYNEKLVNNSEELEKAITDQYNNFDFYIVGRGLGVKSPLTKGLIDSGDSPVLGPIGDTLVSSIFTAHASVLVVQRSTSGGLTPSMRRLKTMFKHKKWASPILNPEYEAITQDKTLDY